MRSSTRVSRSVSSLVSLSCFALPVLGAAAGCSSSNGTPTSNDYDDVAQSTAAIVATPGGGGGGEIGSMYDVATIAIGASPSGVTVNAQGSYDDVVAGVTYSFTVSCTNAAGTALPQCGSTTNDAQATVSWSGNLTLPDYTASVTRSGNWNVTGLQSGTATFNGTGSLDYSSQFTSAFRSEQASTNLTYNGSYDAVVYDQATHLVSAGTVSYAINASGMASSTSGAASGSFTINAVVTFAANGTATITLDGTHTYLVTALGVLTKV